MNWEMSDFVVIDAFTSIKLREILLFKGNRSPFKMAFVIIQRTLCTVHCACTRIWVYFCRHHLKQQTIVIMQRGALIGVCKALAHTNYQIGNAIKRQLLAYQTEFTNFEIHIVFTE